MQGRHGAGSPLDALEYCDVADTLSVITTQMEEATELVQLRPVYQRQQKDFDVLLVTLTRLVHLLLHVRCTEEQGRHWKRQLYRLLKLRPRTCAEGNTLLHLAVSASIQPKSQFDEALVRVRSLVGGGGGGGMGKGRVGRGWTGFGGRNTASHVWRDKQRKTNLSIFLKGRARSLDGIISCLRREAVGVDYGFPSGGIDAFCSS